MLKLIIDDDSIMGRPKYIPSAMCYEAISLQQSPSLVICGKTNNTTTIPHLQQLFSHFLAFDYECARSSIVVDASTMLNDAILRTMTLRMCCSMMPRLISNVKVGEKIFGRAMMVFNL
jgi:hypothetical protein